MTCRFAPANVRLLGSGSALPGEPIDNTELLDALAALCGNKAARQARRIVRQLGIEQRYLTRHLDRGRSQPQVDNPTLCSRALHAALNEADRDASELDYLLGHTTTPHTLIPPNIAWVAERLDCAAPYLELRQACTGFASALQIAAPMLAAGNNERIAIVGSEVGSVYFDATPDFLDAGQLVNYVQMGDGAAAVVLGPDEGTAGALISDIYIGHIGNNKAPGLQLAGAGSADVACPYGLPRFVHDATSIREQGAALFQAGVESIQGRGYHLDDFQWILPHQVNGHLARLLADALGVDPARVVIDADRVGNLGSAAIWLSLDRLRHSGRLESGDRVLALGAEATKYIYGGFVYEHA